MCLHRREVSYSPVGKKRANQRIIKYVNSLTVIFIWMCLEMFDRPNFSGDDRAYREYQYVLEEIFPQFDALMPISTFIESHYREKGMKTICLPIMADSQEFPVKQKNFDKWRFVIPLPNSLMSKQIRRLSSSTFVWWLNTRSEPLT